jgi:guanine deaminase
MTLEQEHGPFILEALSLAREAMRRSAPFGAIMARNGIVVARGMNESVPRHDATAHAEVMCIRAAGAALSRTDFSDCVLYSSCEPCPMCLAACYWAQIPKIYYAATSTDGSNFGFDDAMIFQEICRSEQERKITSTCLLNVEGLRVFEEWSQSKRPLQAPP